jgi:hypothetical protein
MVPAIVRNAARNQLELLPAIVGIRRPSFEPNPHHAEAE